MAQDLSIESSENVKSGKEAATFASFKPLQRPEGITNGVMKADPAKCSIPELRAE